MSPPSQNSHSWSESEVSTNWTPKPSESSDCSGSDKSTTALSWELIKPQAFCWEKLSLTSLSATPLVRPSRSSSTREDTARLPGREFPSPATPSSSRPSARPASTPLKIWSIRFTQLAPTSSKPTTSYGHSSSVPQEEDSPTRGIPSKEEETGETESNSSTNSSAACFDDDPI